MLTKGNQESDSALAAWLSPPYRGEPIVKLPSSGEPLFPLLLALAVRHAVETDGSLLRQWFTNNGVDHQEARIALVERACRNAESAALDEPLLRAYAYATLGSEFLGAGLSAAEEHKPPYLNRAIEAYRQSLEIRPKDPATLHNLGGALANHARVLPEEERRAGFEKAIEAYRQSLEIRPKDPATLRNLGGALANHARVLPEEERRAGFEKAIEAYRQSLEIRPKDPATLRNLGGALADHARVLPEEERRAGFEKAIEAYRQSLEIRPKDPDTLHNLGGALADHARVLPEEERRAGFEKAIEAYRQSLEIRPDEANTLNSFCDPLLGLWRVCSTVGDKEAVLAEADAAIRRARELDPSGSRYDYNYACVLARQGKHDLCIEVLTELLKKRPERKVDVAKDWDFEDLADQPAFLALIAPHQPNWDTKGGG